MSITIKSEIGWSQFQCQFTPSFKDLFDFSVNNGLYSVKDPLEKYVFVVFFNVLEVECVIYQSLVFQWLAIPWLQIEINKWVRVYNSSPRQVNKNKSLPHGIPDLIHAKPEQHKTSSFQMMNKL